MNGSMWNITCLIPGCNCFISCFSFSSVFSSALSSVCGSTSMCVIM